MQNDNLNFRNLLPPLVLLTEKKQKELFLELKKLEFISDKKTAA